MGRRNPVALECGKVRRDGRRDARGRTARASDAPDYRRAARCGGASQGKRAMIRCSMSAGVLLIHSSLAGLVTSSTSRGQPLRIPSTFRCPWALYGGRESLELIRGGILAGANALAVASGETEACG